MDQNWLTRQLCCLALLIALLTGFTGAARGSRAGSFRSGSYSSYRSGSSRYGAARGISYSTMSLLVTNRFTVRVIRSSYARGIIFATPSWRASHAYYADGTTLCFNIKDGLPDNYMYANATNSSAMVPWLYQSRQVYGVFVCPMEESRSQATYCCGSNESQQCCTFWEDGGRVAGLFLGLAAGIITVLASIYYIRKRCFKNKAVVSAAASETQQVTLHHVVEAAVATNPASTSMWQDADKEQPPVYSVAQAPHGVVAWPDTQQSQPQPPPYWEVNNYSGENEPPPMPQMPASSL